MEIRYTAHSLQLAEIRANDAKFQLVGRAISYNTPSAIDVPAPGWREVVAPGAFKKTLSAGDCDIRALWAHDSSKPLGRQKNGTLKLQDGNGGLDFVLQLDRTSQFHQDCFASVKRGDVDAMSFCFTCDDDKIDDVAKIRTVTAATLLEISFVTFPAYDKGTSAEARAALARGKKAVREAREAIEMLRRAAQAMAPKRDAGAGDEMALVRDHLQMAHEAMENAFACSHTARQISGAYDVDNSDEDDDYRKAFRAFRVAHREAHDALSECCNQMARCRLAQPLRKKK